MHKQQQQQKHSLSQALKSLLPAQLYNLKTFIFHNITSSPKQLHKAAFVFACGHVCAADVGSPLLQGVGLSREKERQGEAYEPGCAVLCCAVLCCAMLCCAMLGHELDSTTSSICSCSACLPSTSQDDGEHFKQADDGCLLEIRCVTAQLHSAAVR